jgi:hypothetical protein
MLLAMQDLSLELYKENVIVTYFGYINIEVLNEFLKLTRDKLTALNESILVVKRVYNVINECLENIIKHNFYPEGLMVNYKALILIAKHDNEIHIDTINIINKDQRLIIEQRFQSLIGKSTEELKALKAQTISNHQYSEVVTAGLGIIDMVSRSDGFSFKFNDYTNGNFLFNMHFKINSSIK